MKKDQTVNDMEKFISCDWGTSSFRLKLVEAATLSVLAERSTGRGIAAVFKLWSQGADAGVSRLEFYQSILEEELKMLEWQEALSLDGLPVILSGMASSSLGMMELPYKELPFSTDGSDLSVRILPAGASFRHELTMISGARTDDDVMRGEETQLVGTAIEEKDRSPERIFIFPGTHSKHILVKDNKAVEFRTYMTGEFFGLLSEKSILAPAVAAGGKLDGECLQHFREGVNTGASTNLLHSAFLVRTRHLLGEPGKEENYFYLSGLLIGTELKELAGKGLSPVLVCKEELKEYYLVALRQLGIEGARWEDAATAAIRGQYRIYQGQGRP